MNGPTGESPMFEATVVVLGDHVNTDLLHPPSFFSRDARHAAAGALAGLGLDLADLGPEPYVLVGGRNFGCGSSRESTMRALREAGVRALVARSFAHIFHRTALALGLWPVVAPHSPGGLATGMRVTLDPVAGRLAWVGGTLDLLPPDPWEHAVLEAGGIPALLEAGGNTWDAVLPGWPAEGTR